MERSFEAWEEVQRHGQDLADRLAQGFSGLLQSPSVPFTWPLTPPKNPFDLVDLQVAASTFSSKDIPAAAAASFLGIGGRLGQAGAELGASVSGAAQQIYRLFPGQFRHEEVFRLPLPVTGPEVATGPVAAQEAMIWDPDAGGAAELGFVVERIGERGVVDAVGAVSGSGAVDEEDEEEGFGCEIGTFGNFKKARVWFDYMFPSVASVCWLELRGC